MSIKATLQPPARDGDVVGTFVAPAANPTAFIIRPNNSTAYTANNIVANTGTPYYPPLLLARRPGVPFIVRRLRLRTNHTTGLAGVVFNTRLWEQQPVYGANDGGAYSITTGGAFHVAKFQGTWEQFSDYAICELSPLTGYEVTYTGRQSLTWDMQTLTAFTPQALKQFDIFAEEWLG